jgi:hypothetical protein
MIEPGVLKLFGANPFSNRQRRVDKARRTSMEVDDDIETTGEQPQRRAELAVRNDNLVEVWVPIKAVGEPRIHKYRDAKLRELFFDRPDRACQQKTVAHGPQPDEQNSSVRRKIVKVL